MAIAFVPTAICLANLWVGVGVYEEYRKGDKELWCRLDNSGDRQSIDKDNVIRYSGYKSMWYFHNGYSRTCILVGENDEV